MILLEACRKVSHHPEGARDATAGCRWAGARGKISDRQAWGAGLHSDARDSALSLCLAMTIGNRARGNATRTHRGSAPSRPGFNAPISREPPPGGIALMPTQQTPEEARSSTADAPSDHDLLVLARDGGEEAARQLYFRYAKRLNRLVERQCSPGLARRAGVEDIVQSAFGSFFRRIRRGSYDIPDGDDLWKLLLVITLHKIRKQGRVPSRGQAQRAPDHGRRGGEAAPGTPSR